MPKSVNTKKTKPRHPTLATTQEVADICGVSRTTIWRLQKQGRFPEAYNIGTNSKRWNRAEVLQWFEQTRSSNVATVEAS